MTQDNNPNAVADDLANRLMKLHRDLEDRGDRGTDLSLGKR
ncbi:hypothetical protein [Burkholderia cepacia]|nr:hypothetical protein [Burkholderia cepacia]MDO5948069.1 hypothetical protein [Burkholderia cepacia]